MVGPSNRAQARTRMHGRPRFRQTSIGGWHKGGPDPASQQPEGGSKYSQHAESIPFGQSKPAFGTFAFGQKPAFGVFGSPNIAQSSPSGNAFGQMQPTFGVQPLGTTSQPASTAASTSAFRSTSTPVFGTTRPTLDAGSVPYCGASSIPVFGASSTPAVGASKTPLFGFGSTISFGQVAPPFGASSAAAIGSSTTFRGTPSPFDQSSAFGAHSTDATFESPGFGQTSSAGQGRGSRVTPYNVTEIVDGQAPEKLISISSMPQYKDKSLEELRWEDYQSGDKGASASGQKTAFGVFGSQNLAQSSPLGSTFGQKQADFGNQPFRAISQPASGATGTPEFGSTTTPAFGTTASALGATSVPAFVASSTPAFWTSITLATGASSTPPFGFGNIVTLGQPVMALGAASTPAFGNGTPYGITSPPFGQSLAFGAQFTTPTFGSPGFGQTSFVGQCGGSRVAPYTSTRETENASSGEGPVKLISISAMPQYKVKSHEELRWEDYTVGDKGGPFPARQQPAGGSIFSQPAQSNSFGQTNPAFGTSTFGTSSTPAAGTSNNPPLGFGNTVAFGQPVLAFGTASTPAFLTAFGVFGLPSLGQSSPFGSTFGQTQPAFGNLPFGAISQPASSVTNTPAFGFTLTPAFGTATSAFGAPSVSAFGASSTPVFGTSSTSAFGNLPFGAISQPASSVTNTPTFGSTSTPAFGTTTSAFGATSVSAFGASSTPVFGTSSTPAAGTSNNPPLGFGNTVGFGQPVLAFGTVSTPAFGNRKMFGCTSSLFGQSSHFGTSAFGVSGSPGPAQSNPFGSNFCQMQQAFGTQPFGATSPSAFSAPGTPAFGCTSTPAFGTTTPAFGAINAFGPTIPAFVQASAAYPLQLHGLIVYLQ